MTAIPAADIRARTRYMMNFGSVCTVYRIAHYVPGPLVVEYQCDWDLFGLAGVTLRVMPLGEFAKEVREELK